ncbi:hypothetical protein GXW82_31445 [Streptacidiphilus sp. 4-A2]|nr:hypothetical protein [Streptacidiphilus sp. 4-A2]
MVHAELLAGTDTRLPDDMPDLLTTCSYPGEGVEFVVVHRNAGRAPVIGLFMLAESLSRAEEAATAVCLRALASQPALSTFELERCEGRMVPAYYEQLLREGSAGRLMPWQYPDSWQIFLDF